MRHLKKGKKFHRPAGRREAFLRNLTNNLIRRERIVTTRDRAKAVRPVVEQLVTTAKKQDIHSRRLIMRRVHDKQVVQKLCDDLGTRYQDRPGGYTRITKSAQVRKRDGAELATIEFV